MTTVEKKKIRWIALILSVIAAIWILLSLADRALGPVIRQAAVSSADIQLTRIINDVAAECLADQDIVRVEKTENGSVTAIRVDTAAANKLRTAVTDKVTQRICRPGSNRISVPLGTLTGIDLLSGKGALIDIRIMSVQSGKAEYFSEFSSAGINQTVHRIVLRVQVEVVLLLATQTVRKTVTTDIVAAETVIVGKVPFTG